MEYMRSENFVAQISCFVMLPVESWCWEGQGGIIPSKTRNPLLLDVLDTFPYFNEIINEPQYGVGSGKVV